MYLLHPAARDEVEDAARWYEQQVEGLGERFLGALESTLERVARRPHLGPVWTATAFPRDASVRRIRVPEFPYVVVYAVDDEQVVVVAVAHSRREPGYWTRRVQG